MELRQLAYFDAVVRHGGFTRAADRLHVAQPAISAQVRRLEADLGVSLLARTTRRVALTHAGELFLVRARRILDQVDAARAEAAQLAAVLRGRVRLGATEILGSLDLPAAMARFRRQYPGVSLALRTGLIAELLAALDSGEIDIVLGPIHAELPDHYLARPLVEESLVLVTAPDHPLSTGHAGTLADVADVRDDPFVCLPAGSGLHTILTAAAAAEGFTPRIEFETRGPTSIRELVAAGLGVALLATSAAHAPGPPIAIHRLRHAPPHPAIGLIQPRYATLTPAVRAFEDDLAHRAGVT